MAQRWDGEISVLVTLAGSDIAETDDLRADIEKALRAVLEKHGIKKKAIHDLQLQFIEGEWGDVV